MKRLTMIGLGLCDERSIPLLGLERMRESDRVLAEFYTSLLVDGAVDRISALIGMEVELLGRGEVEEGGFVVEALRDSDRVCFLTAGDPLMATTHQEIRLSAMREGIEVEVIHSASIQTAAPGISGLQHYKFGRTTTLAFPEKGFFPTSPLDVIADNLGRGIHTLVLLDIKAEEGRYMTIGEGIEMLLKMEEAEGGGVIGMKLKAVGIARAGRPDLRAAYGSLDELRNMDFGPPPHCIVIPGKLHFMEEEMLQELKL